MKYRKGPIVIEAVQFWPDSLPWPAGVMNRPGAICGCVLVGGEGTKPHIHTLEGPMIVSPGDWIITGVNGEWYPCKPDIFAATYEPATGDAVSADPPDWALRLASAVYDELFAKEVAVSGYGKRLFASAIADAVDAARVEASEAVREVCRQHALPSNLNHWVLALRGKEPGGHRQAMTKDLNRSLVNEVVSVMSGDRKLGLADTTRASNVITAVLNWLARGKETVPTERASESLAVQALRSEAKVVKAVRVGKLNENRDGLMSLEVAYEDLEGKQQMLVLKLSFKQADTLACAIVEAL